MTSTYHHGNLHNELIKGGLRMLTRDGIAAFSLRKLSVELGVSHAAAYRHFSSKEDLLRAILIESSNRFSAALEASISRESTEDEALMQLGVGYVLFFVKNPEILALFNLLPSADSPLLNLFSKDDASEKVIADCTSHDWTNIESLPDSCSFTLLSKLVAQFKKHDQFKELSDREIMLGYWGKVHGIASILVTQKNFIPEEDIGKVVERVVRTPF